MYLGSEVRGDDGDPALARTEREVVLVRREGHSHDASEESILGMSTASDANANFEVENLLWGDQIRRLVPARSDDAHFSALCETLFQARQTRYAISALQFQRRVLHHRGRFSIAANVHSNSQSVVQSLTVVPSWYRRRSRSPSPRHNTRGL